MRRKQVISILVLMYFGRPRLDNKKRIKPFQIGLLIQRYTQFWISTIFCVRFSRKILLMLCSINWPNFIECLLLLEIFVDICVLIICCPVREVINFGINHQSFFIKFFFYKWKRQEINVNISRTKSVSNMQLKAFFNIFKELLLK